MPEAEVVGICVNGARPALKPHLVMAKPTTMDELMKLPVVVSDVVEEVEPVQHLFQTLNARFILNLTYGFKGFCKDRHKTV